MPGARDGAIDPGDQCLAPIEEDFRSSETSNYYVFTTLRWAGARDGAIDPGDQWLAPTEEDFRSSEKLLVRGTNA